MKKAAQAAFAAFFAVGMSTIALAVPAHADGYGATVVVDISDVTVIGGQRIRVVAEARTSGGNPVQCAWRVVFHGASAPFVNGPNPDTGAGSTFNKIYTTDRVPHTKRGFATATCTYDDTTVPTALGGVGRFSTAFAAALQTASATGEVNLLPRHGENSDSDSNGSDSDSNGSDSDSDSDHGGLPNTGGERLLWLLIGLALLAGGTTVVVTSRERS
jgi:hypothetical protein